VRRARNGEQHFRDGRLLLEEFGHPILQLRSGPFPVDTLAHVKQFLGLDGEGSITVERQIRQSHPATLEVRVKLPRRFRPPPVNQGSGLCDYDGILSDRRPIARSVRNRQTECH
jgi:hypothetical protein